MTALALMEAMEGTSRIYRRPGIFCGLFEDGEAILLDLPGDRYIGISSRSARLWDALEEGCSRDDLASVLEGEGIEKERSRVLVDHQLEMWDDEALIQRTNPTNVMGGKRLPICDRSSTTPADGLLDGETIRKHRPGARDTADLLRARLAVRTAAKKGTLLELLDGLQELPRRDVDNDETQTTLLRLVRGHRLLRLPFDRGTNDCLHSALVLHTALRRRGIASTYCIGANKFPFVAHAWVEADRCVLDERLLFSFTVLGRF